MFRQLFERSADAIFLFDPVREYFVDCNQAAVEMMRASSKEQLLLVHPAELSPEFQADGQTSREKTPKVTAVAIEKGSHRFEWLGRRMDGTEFPLEVLLTPIQTGEHPLLATVCRDITERKAGEQALRESEQKFRELFQTSSDAIQILDPQERRIVDCNDATVSMARAESKEWFLKQPVTRFSPEHQPDGSVSLEASRAWSERALVHGPQRFEWMARRCDGEELPVEVLLMPVQVAGRRMLVSVSRDISKRKKNERELLELNQSLERRVAERTAALTTSEAQFRALVEHAPEAIVVFDGVTGRFQFGNEHACRLYGVPMEKLATLTPVEVSAEYQAGGRPTTEVARERIDEALAGGTPVFDWIHRRPDGSLIPTEVRLLRLPTEGQNLLRASITDNTERDRAQRALRESEEKFRALFEGSIQGIVLHDEVQILEANPAAVKIMGCSSPQDLLGKHPGDTSPEYQPNGESSASLSRRYIQECMQKGSARFEWVSRNFSGRLIPLEVTLTRIEWSGRQVIQALITDITERKQAEEALRDINRKLRHEIEQRIRAEESLNERIQTATLSTDVALALNAGTELPAMLQQCAELTVRHLEVTFARIWTLNEATQTLELQASAGCYTHLDGPHSRVRVGELKIGLIAQEKKPHLTNKVLSDPRVSDKEWAAREGMVSFAGYPLLLEGRVLGVLALFARRPLGDEVMKALGSIADSIALGIERKRSQSALAESEERFSVAFQASPVFIGIARMNDGRYVLINDAFVNWSGHSREEILGRNSIELNLWERPKDREDYWSELQTTGSVRARECRYRNRDGQIFTMLVSSEVIQLNGVPHILSLGLDITERKRTEAELKASEARLRESEARFSAAFHSSPALIGILRMSDGKYVLANDAHLNWLGYPREQVLGRTCLELGMWEQPAEREQLLNEVRSNGSVRQKECLWRNRKGELFTVLLSADTIQLNDTPHMLLMALDITQRKRAEEELRASESRLRESEARFSVAFHSTPLFTGIARMSDGHFVLVNDALVNWSGYTREEMLGKSTSELSVWERQEERDAYWAELRQTGSIRARECRFRNRHGEQLTLLLSSEVIELNGAPHMLTSGLDITKRKRAEAGLQASEARLRESEARFSVAFQASPVFIGVMRSSDEKYVLANDALLNWAGYSREELLGRTSAELGMWHDPAERDEVWKVLRTTGSVRQREVCWRNRHGQRFTILLSVEAITLDNAPHVLSLAQDISQRKQAELELQASEARLRKSETRFSAAFHSSPIITGITRGSDGKFVLVNDEAVKWMGCGREEILGRNARDLEIWENPDERDRFWGDVRNSGTTLQRECRLKNRRGKVSTMLASGVTIELNGEDHFLVMMVDISPRKQAEAELLRTLAREMELGQLKSNFVSMVSHEFRTPLGIIQSSAELLHEFYDKMQPPERGEQLESITRNTRRMAAMMEEILVLSRLDAGKLEFQPASLDFRGFCQRMVDEVQSATNRRCRIELALDSVPRDASADEQLLGHIFTNLLSNAVKYSEPEAVVRFDIARDGSDAICIVRDMGIGISAEDQEQLFKAFYRGGNVGMRPGTGLGLLVVKRCVDLHRGRVQLVSNLGAGTTVTVRLPIFNKGA
jgi:PAS domain S-box-containing protein